jgi:hypothetical protein
MDNMMDNVIEERVALRKKMDRLYEVGKRQGKKDSEARIVELELDRDALEVKAQAYYDLKKQVREWSAALSCWAASAELDHNVPHDTLDPKELEGIWITVREMRKAAGTNELTMFSCGDQCLPGQEHDFDDNHVVEIKDENGKVRGGTTVCSKCGKTAMDVSMFS